MVGPEKPLPLRRGTPQRATPAQKTARGNRGGSVRKAVAVSGLPARLQGGSQPPLTEALYR